MRRVAAIALYLVLFLVGGGWAAVRSLAPWLRDIVGAPGYLDAATTWQREWLPMISHYLTQVHVWIQNNGYLIILSLAILAFALVHFIPHLIDAITRWRTGPFKIDFATEMPDSGVESVYIRRYEMMANGCSSETHLYSRQCLFSIKNVGDVASKNVKAVIISFTENDQWHPCEIQLPCFGRPPEQLMVHRDESVYFQFLEFVEPDSREHWVPRRHIDAHTFDYLVRSAQPNVLSLTVSVMPTMALPALNGGEPIQPPIGNDRLQLDIAIYSENNPAMYVRFEITRQERIMVKLVARGRSLPKP